MIRNLKKSKLFMLMACVAMLFCVSAGVSAALYADNNITYDVGDSAGYNTTSAVSVTLNIQSEKDGNSYLDESATVILPAVNDGKVYTVRDVIVAWASANGATLTTTVWDAEQGKSVEQAFDAANSTYVFSITKGGVTYGPESVSDYDGFKYRVNTKIAQEMSPYNYLWGATIATTYVKDGDVIDLYYDNPTSADNAARFTRIYDVTAANNALTVTVQESNDWFDTTTWDTTMNNFAAYEDVTVEVYDADGEFVGDGVTNANGQVTITGVTSGETYEIVVVAERDASTGFIVNTGCVGSYTVQ